MDSARARQLALAGWLGILAGWAQGAEVSGHVRSGGVRADTAHTEPLVQAELRSGLHTGSGSEALVWQATATLQAQRHNGSTGPVRGWLNEATVSGQAGAWQWTAGRKVVSWDVGQAFRPNDVVQQEARRTLLPATAIGRPVLMAEHFGTDTAWSLVWANPTHARERTGAEEPALAARAYLRDGAVDWHAFARHGAHTGASLGAAVSGVVSDAVSLYASVRRLQRHDSTALGPRGLRPVLAGPATQALAGLQWTAENQLGLMVEAWSDGTAWQPALRRNLLARLSWTHGPWQPALDVLWHPADRGRTVTASLAWQGDRWRLEGGWRGYAGPAAALVRQLPVQRQGYVLATWAY